MDGMSYREQAQALLATYEHEEMDEYEAHVTRIARVWLKLIRSRENGQALVDDLLADFRDTDAEGYGMGWEELRRGFLAWAEAEEYLEP